ncbi:ornithine carbamoyltransferase [Piscinibacter terrae]|uniref:Ornithine carbamoyltransferase n=1 Tax=Piscinibacter terrae TaxID=2496871 RepID=A0A3N7HWF6_9BURK|nr:ornithine carbamoyltransferase [Albitalea terrae]RQP25736.1 ornithine carbamoyltransferase [Albitalea terrae]
MNLIGLADLTRQDVRDLWASVRSPAVPLGGNVAWSFEGNGIRTRTTFIQAFRELGLSFVELPNFLKTGERARDLAGYLDPFYDVYVIRESNHARLAEFAAASKRPVVNAMSSEGHPCEVLTDAYFIDSSIKPLEEARICLWGPPTNVMRSWHELAQVMGFTVIHACDPRWHEAKANVQFTAYCEQPMDVVITDAWPAGADDAAWSLTTAHLALMGQPRLLPTPPFSIGRELAFDPLAWPGFTGYAQKELLLPVHRAILQQAMSRP